MAKKIVDDRQANDDLSKLKISKFVELCPINAKNASFNKVFAKINTSAMP